jgi:hypothetical protein
MTWPIRVIGSSHMEFLARWRQLQWAFTQTRLRGPGRLTVVRPDGSARWIDAHYSSGFDGTPGGGTWEDDAIVQLVCLDPWWKALETLVIERRYTAAPVPFLAPYPTITSSQTLGDTTIVNPGEDTAWGTWTITGPASGVTATLNSTGESWTLDPDADGVDHGPLLAGEIVTVSTKPLQVRGPAGEVWTEALNWPAAQPWGLPPGESSVTFTVSGSGAGTSIAYELPICYGTA